VEDVKARILVVDDYVDTATMLVVHLQKAGFDASMALSAAEALEMVDREQFVLIIADIAMPAMNGYELVAALRTRKNYHTVPVIAVTGFGFLDDRERSEQAGFNAHMVKPINPLTLISTVNRLLR